MDAGLCGASGMGSVPLTWSDLGDWLRLSGHQVQPWELRALRTASIEYVAQLARSKEPDCPPPWAAEPTHDDRARVSKGLRALFAGR